MFKYQIKSNKSKSLKFLRNPDGRRKSTQGSPKINKNTDAEKNRWENLKRDLQNDSPLA